MPRLSLCACHRPAGAVVRADDGVIHDLIRVLLEEPEELTPEERAEVEAGEAEIARGEWVRWEEIRRTEVNGGESGG